MTLLNPLSFTFLFIFLTKCSSLYSQGTFDLPKPKRIISQFEALAGPSWQYPLGRNADYGRVFKLGYCFGVGGTHTFNDRLELDAKFLFERKGHKGKNDAFVDIYGMYRQTSYNLNDDYLTAVLIPKYCFGAKRKFRIGVGGYVGQLNKSISDVTTTLNGSVASVNSSSQMSIHKKYDYGIVAVFSYDLELSQKIALRFSLSENLGLTNIYINDPSIAVERTQSIYFLLSLIYHR